MPLLPPPPSIEARHLCEGDADFQASLVQLALHSNMARSNKHTHTGVAGMLNKYYTIVFLVLRVVY